MAGLNDYTKDIHGDVGRFVSVYFEKPNIRRFDNNPCMDLLIFLYVIKLQTVLLKNVL